MFKILHGNNALYLSFSVWQKIKSNKETDRWKADMEEEFEDSSGNVVSKKTFEDLKRQGLL
jgi:splicing factor 3A subunit 3